MSNNKVVVAMSGGVDSSLVTYLMVKKYGLENVFGLTFKLFDSEEDNIKKAKKLCEKIGIQHFVIDLRKEFKKEIIDYFIKEYKEGKTPNPCVKCNRKIKFSKLIEEARKLGANNVATGHYVISKLKGGIYRIYKGKDPLKDQSYFLNKLTQYELSHVIFPLGKMRKSKVKRIASKLKLPHLKSESQEVCFITESVTDYLSKHIDIKKGKILDTSGKKLGEHKGAHLYTIGQRRGLGVSSKQPLYVVKTDVTKNEVILGQESHLYEDYLYAEDTNWIMGVMPKEGKILDVKIRYAAEPVKAKVFASNNKVRVDFLAPVKAVTPGQSVVFYDGKELIGGGIIK
ncbi:tRNA 2-thiouridine(34) synthase MnmA [bacterium]|nr:tRNA 2-thiouridine(34) synthase MnmA [bacterium]